MKYKWNWESMSEVFSLTMGEKQTEFKINPETIIFIRHIESEIKAKDERIAELEKQLSQVQLKRPCEPFIFTKDTPVKIEGGEVVLYWDDDFYIYGKLNDSNGKWHASRWRKDNGKNVSDDCFNLIPILPEKKTYEFWLVVYDDINKVELTHFDSEKRAIEFIGNSIGSHIEHHNIELKGKSNV